MAQNKKLVVIYSDGSCSPNPGKGGYAAILKYNQHEKVVTGGMPDTTNQRMELLAVVEALKTLNQPCNVIIHSDSQLVVEGLTSWMKKWIENGWRKPNGQTPAHVDLWQQINDLSMTHDVKAVKVRGHAGIALNERADQLASQAIS